MVIRLALLAGALLGVTNPLIAQVPPEERIPIRDPDRLESLGFPRDATNVYVWSKASLGGAQERSDDGLQPEAHETFGTTGTGFSNVLGLHVEGSNAGFQKGILGTGAYCQLSSSSSLAQAQIQLPEGVALVSFRLWAFDDDPSNDLVVRVFESCQFSGAPSHTQIAQLMTAGSPGISFDNHFFAPGLTANNRDCAYSVIVYYNGFPVPSFGCQGTHLVLEKMRFQWRRQISPPPVFASFLDVPSSHLYFQAIEALADSGITLGCGSGNFCPSGNVTRGEMAAFLARALGLHWP